MYEYSATLVRVIDGDTFVMNIDLGFHVHVEEHIRVEGYFAPELGTPEGKVAKMAAVEVFYGAENITLKTKKSQPQSFARWVASIYIDGRWFNDLMDKKGIKLCPLP